MNFSNQSGTQSQLSKLWGSIMATLSINSFKCPQIVCLHDKQKNSPLKNCAAFERMQPVLYPSQNKCLCSFLPTAVSAP